MNNIEPGTNLLFAIIRPVEIRTISVDFKKFGAGTLVSIVSPVPVTARGNVPAVTPLTVTSVTILGTVVTFKEQGGDDGEDYEITLTVTDNTNQTFSDDIVLKVRKAGLV